jgi:hypothetical protein
MLGFTASADAACPNEAIRTQQGATSLSDCRAWELVTPPDTNGRLLEGLSDFGFDAWADLFPTELASPTRDSFVYLTYNSPLLTPGAPNGIFDFYEAERSPTGWQTTRQLTPTGSQAVRPLPGGISSDHRYTAIRAERVENGSYPGGSLVGEGGTDYLGNPDGSFEPTGIGSLGVEPFAQSRYVTENGSHVIFSTGHDLAQSLWCKNWPACPVRRLEPNAAPTGTGAVYDRAADGPTHVISLLPGNAIPAAGEEAFYQGASRDGTVVAFKIGEKLYARVNNSKTVETPGTGVTFAGLSADGDKLFYVSGGDIHRYDTSAETDVEVNSSGDAEVVNVSADGSHVYFISPSQLDFPEGVSGQPNMYVWSGSGPKFVTTVAPSDLERTSGSLEHLPALTNWTDYAVAPTTNLVVGPGADSSRTTPDGNVIVFESRGRLTDYDNAEHTEVYRYEDQTSQLRCVSCNPAVEPAISDARLQELGLVSSAMVIHNVSDDGSRVFFETSEPLSSADIDGINDIYEWQEGSPLGGPKLVSSGRSTEYPPLKTGEVLNLPLPNVMFGATPTGNDVFFITSDALVPEAATGGTAGIYDARVDGGFTRPAPAPPCSEQGCRGSGSGGAPSLEAPQSDTKLGTGNVKRHKHRCHKRRRTGKHSKHRACTRKHSKKRKTAQKAGASSVLPSSDQSVSGGASGTDAPTGNTSPATAVSAPTASAASGETDFSEFGIKSVSAGISTSAAGRHPDLTTDLVLNSHLVAGHLSADAKASEISVSLPPGLVGNPNVLPQCSTGQLVAWANCPIDSQVGIAKVFVDHLDEFTEPIYNLTPPHPDREVARFGFYAQLYPVFIDVKVRTASDYGVTATVHSSPGLAALLKAETTFWGNPADSSHDELRLTAVEALTCATVCKEPGGKRKSGLGPVAFLDNPSACQTQEVGFQVASYQLPGQTFTKAAPLEPITACAGLPFAPSFEATPTNHRAGAPTGLKTVLRMPQHLGAEEPATATMKEARVSLPDGMAIAAGAANDIAACSEDQVGFHREVEANCPDASKLGVATIVSPALPVPLQGAIYQRTPSPGHQFGLWLVSDALGLHIKLPGEIQADPTTGRLTAVFADLPQVPVEEIDFDIWGGPGAPLKNPDACGTYQTAFSFLPHSADPAVNGQSEMKIDEGCDRGFDPGLRAGATKPVAGAFSPFVFDLFREDGNQPLRGFALTLPQGELAKPKGVPLCPDDAALTGACPAASQIGSLTVASGPGPNPLWLPQPGKPQPAIYLAGPYAGAPYSIVTAVPAQAGPFDLGVVTVRSGLYIDPETAQVTVKADPLPQFVEGVATAYRRLHAVIDRRDFSLNPTDCREMAVEAEVHSTQGAVAHPKDRFQVDGCGRLEFKPTLSLKLRGGTKRTDYPALNATLKARKGDANLARVSVALPHSEFLAQEHIGTICTRVQFAARKCPKGSVYGRAKAWTPLLDKPLSGPVYLRSSDHPLPDLVIALRGQIEIDVAGRIDSKNGGIRTTFEQVPDAPIRKFVLRMYGGAKGLLTNSQNICGRARRAVAQLGAQNGRLGNQRPPLKTDCAKGR